MVTCHREVIKMQNEVDRLHSTPNVLVLIEGVTSHGVLNGKFCLSCLLVFTHHYICFCSYTMTCRKPLGSKEVS